MGIRRHIAKPTTADGIEFRSRLEAHKEVEDLNVSDLQSPQAVDYWSLVSKQDRLRLTSSPPRERCPWCGGITIHSAMCEEQLADWARLKWGKYKGKLVSDVPTDYLEFVLDGQYGSTFDRRMILDELQQRDGVFKSLHYECLAS